MKLQKFVGIGLLVLSVTGCVKEGQYLGGFLEVKTGNSQTEEIRENEKSGNNGASQKGEPAASIDESRFEGVPYREGEVAFSSAFDVDTIFIKMKNEFGFLTEDEVRREWGSMADFKLADASFKYDAIPGVYYKMKKRPVHNYKGQDRRHNIYCEINKNGSESEIVFKFWIKDPQISNIDDYALSIKNRALSAIGE